MLMSFSVMAWSPEGFVYNVFFGSDSAELNEKAKQSVALIYAKIPKTSKGVINVQGPYKSKASNVYINILSNERTNAVYQYLIEKGVQKDDISMRIMRNSKPVTQLTDELLTNSDLTFQVVVNKQ
jgi:outer membrane protein OmpA-like peptidoglycan-associated protein